ncbi:MAG: hypothetical protein WBQ14_04155 [Gaiellaceae bacterium]
MCALVLIGTSTLAGAASSKSSTAKISAHLTKTSFTRPQASSVKLIYSFSATSSSFGYVLRFKNGSVWQTIKSVKRRGFFRGSYEIKVKELFVKHPVEVGKYRLKVFTDGGSKLLSFAVESKPENTVLPTILGATRQGQALTASKGSWKYAPTSYAYRWRRCNKAGASCSNIASAGASSYRLTAKDVAGSTVVVVVTATNFYGSTSAISTPMAAGATVQAIGADYNHTCALSSAGTVKCWGANSFGQLGNGMKADSLTPVQVKGVGGKGILSNVTQISASGRQFVDLGGLVDETLNEYGGHTCALLTNHTVECWGGNWRGQLGNGTTKISSTPVRVKGAGGTGVLSNVTQISAGGVRTCALLSDSTVVCWGGGGLGNGTYRSSTTPVQVKGAGGTGMLSNVTQISAGHDHTCALLADHTIECWGSGDYGQLGNGTMSTSDDEPYGVVTPAQVKGVGGTGALSNVNQINAGDYHTCALLTDRTVECWGVNWNGELGNGTKANSATPIQVKDAAGTGTLSNVTQISAGGSHTCALLADHTIECWGAGGSGELGNGSFRSSSTPIQVTNIAGTTSLSEVTQIVAGGKHTCALLIDNTLECWGFNEQGQLGVGTTVDSLTPVQVEGVGGVGTF